MENIEIEAKFLEIDKAALIQKLRDLGARDRGEVHQRDVIFYDGAGEWVKTGKQFVRVRQEGDKISLTYKHEKDGSLTGVQEIEFSIDDLEKATSFLLEIGLIIAREQEKYRHTFIMDGVNVDIDTWPKIPTWVELEGPTEEAVKQAALRLGFNWERAVFGTAQSAIEKYYKIPLRKVRYFTFARVE